MELEDRIVAFAARCVKVCAALPVKNVGSASFADQLFRSSTSVAANYAEACEAESVLSESKELSRILSASVITTKKKIGG